MKGTRSLLLKGALWIGAARVVINLIGTVSTILLARLLVPEDFGLVAIATAVLMIFSVISEMPLSQALVQHDNPVEAHYHTVWTMTLIRGILLGLVIAASAWPLAAFYSDPRLFEVFLVMAVTVSVGGLMNPKLVIFQRRLEFHQAFVLNVTEKIVGFVVAISIAVIYRSYWALVIAPLVSQTARVAASYWLKPFRPRLVLSHYRDLLSFSIWMTFGNWVQAANWRSDPLVLGYLLSPALLGQYSMGNRMSGIAIRQLTSPVQQVLFPAFSRLKDDQPRLRLAYLRAQGVLCICSFPLGAGLAVLAEEFVLLFLGSKWELAIPVIQILAFITAAQMLVNLNPIAMATGHTKALFGRDLRTFVIRWPLLLLGIYLGSGSAYGMLLGAVLGRAASVVLNSIWNMQLVSRISTISMLDQLMVVWRPALAALAMGGAVFVGRDLLPDPTGFVMRATELGALIALGAFAYGLSLFLLWLAGGRQEGAETEAVSILGKFLGKMTAKFGY